MSSFLSRLRERKLAQWALAYLAGAWLIFEATEVLAGPWNLSPTFQRGVHLLLGIGFFIMLVLAWYHGEKGRQRVSGPELLIVAGLLAVAGVIVTVIAPTEEAATPHASAGPTDSERELPAIAVLPFHNISPDPGDAYFADGMQEEIITQLQKVSGIVVISRTSTMRYREDPPPAPEIATQLGVDFILEGSARKAGERVRLTVQLIDAGRDVHLWADEYDRDLTAGDLFEIQSDLALRITGALAAEISPEEKARIEAPPTLNLEAHDEYFRGRFEWNKRTPDGFSAAIGHFQRATELDPTFALAYAGLADAHVLMPVYLEEDVDSRASYHAAESAAQRALSLDPTLAEALVSLGGVRMRAHYDWVGAEARFLRAIELSPAYATAHHWYSLALSVLGRHEEALAEARRALQMDPLSVVINLNLAQNLRWAGDYEAAITQYERTLELSPEFPPSWLWLAESLLWARRFDDARHALGRFFELTGGAAETGSRLVDLVVEYDRTGRPGLVPPDIEDAAGDRHGRLFDIYALAGQREKTLEWLERAYERRNSGILFLKDPAYDFLRDDPRFIELMRNVNLSP
ncbi:MAG: tetratricopeptide repeat protein [Gemmatimonadota bacterium]|nr:MAG: tetratricopeptide repeat protein [Gemmatimonadota bacterium]